MAIKNKDAVKFVYVNGSSLPTTVDDSTIYIIGETAEMYVGSLKIAARIAVDSELDTTSFNPVENQAVTKELNKKATIASPTFTGTPKAPTAAAGTSTTQIATTAFVQSAITASTIIVDDAISGTSLNPVQNKVIKAVLDAKANLASPTFTGTPKAPTAPSGTNTTQIATTEFVQTSLSDKADISDIPVATTTTPKANGTAAVGSETKWAKGDHVHPSDTTKANLASPTFTGTPKAPTASKGTSTTQLATTAYVQNELVDYIKDNSSAPIAYGTCNTAADVDEKIITLSSDNPDWELEVGSLIAIRFTAKNTATSPTFNVNGTGARPIGYDTSDSNNGWAAGEANVTSLYVYNGTCYMWLSHSVDNNTTYTNATLGQGYATSTPPTSGVAVTATLSSYALTVGGVVVVKFNTNPVPASATLNINSKGAKAIYYRGVAISANTILAGDTATFIYNGSQYHLVAIDRWGQIATTSSDGLMSASDKSKLDGITATYTAVTGKPTSNQTPAFGGTATISQVSQSTTGQVTVTDRTIKIPNSEASTSASGLMSSTDKTKLDGIAEGANAYTHPSYTARTGKPTGNQTPAFGETATVSQITSDATGHVTSATDRTIKIPNTEATTSTAGLMSASDKSKLDGIATGATKVTVDSAMSTTSTNPVQNKVVKQAIDDAIAASDAMIFKGTLGTNGDITALPTTYKTGWTYRVITAGTYAGNVCEVGDLIIALVDRSGSGNVNADWTVAQTNINGAITNITTTSPIAVSGSGSSRALSHANSGVTAAAKGDTSNQTPAFGGTFKVPSGTVNATGHLTAFADHTVTIPDAEATTSTSGLMSSTDKTKLDSITATYTAVTGKPTANQTPAFGGTATISQVSQSATGQVSVTDRTIKIPNATATTSASGLMSSADKSKLDGVATGANNYTHPSYTARTGVPTANQTPAFGGTFTVNQVNSDATGHVTASTSRTITIPGNEATTSAKGLMSSADKSKLDGIAIGANAYVHPSYTARTGKPTGNQTPAFGGTATVSQITSDASGHITGATDRTIKIPDTVATTSAPGLMSAADKTKLDGITDIPVPIASGGTSATTKLDAANSLEVMSLSQGTEIPVNTDLNTISTVGNYYCSTTVNTETLTNCPSARAFKMEVGRSVNTGYLYQKITRFDTGVIYYRYNDSVSFNVSKWSTWKDFGAFLPITGGTITNGTTAAYVNNIHSGIKLEEADNGITANVHPSNARFYATLNGSNTLTSVFEHNNYTDGFVGASMTVRNYNTTTEKMSGFFGLRVAVDKSGQCRYIVAGKEFKNAIGIAYGTCDTAAATATKVVTVDGLGYALTSGAIIGVKFTNTNTANSPTLNVNNTGAKSIWYDTALITTSNQKFAGEANRITFFMYDGTQWVWIGHGANDANGYLLLTGGTVSGATTIQNLLTLHREGTTADDLPAGIKFSVKDTDTTKTYNKAYIYAYQDHQATTNGVNLVLNSGGNTIIGSGEAAGSHYAALKNADTGLVPNTEYLYLTSDSLINIQANGNSIANRKGVQITTAGALVPVVADTVTNNVQSIGTSIYKWNAMYATTFYGDLSGNATTATTATTAATATEFSANKAVTLTGDVTGTASSKGGWSVATTLANSGVTAGSYGPSANASPAFGGTFSVPYITVDAKGRATAASTKTITLPAAPTTITGNAGSATKLATGRAIDGVTFDGSTAIVHYGTCSTAAGTAAKVVSCTSFTLVTGSTIRVKFTVTNTAASPTLNVNSTGAKNIFYKGAAITAGYLIKDHVYEFVYDGTQYCLVGEIYSATTESIGSASAGTAIAADDITAWSAGTLPTLGTAIPADDITAWSAGTAASASVSNGVLTITNGTAPSLTYTAKSIPNVTAVGTLPSLTYTARSIPNISVTNKTVVTAI